MTGGGVVTLLTDFGPGSAYVGQMHGVLLARDATLRVIDLAHDLPPGGVAAAAYVLQRSYEHFPVGTTHVAVVDPGVGTERRILAARAHGHTFLAPDNGLLAPLLGGVDAAAVHSVENTTLMNPEIASTFHGRDIFAPVAAWLAAGGDIDGVGPSVAPQHAAPLPAAVDGALEGHVLLVDRFGNLITDVAGGALDGLGDPAHLRVRAGALRIDGLVQTFADVPRDAPLSYIGSGGHLEIAVNGGRASDALGLAVGDGVRVERGTA